MDLLSLFPDWLITHGAALLVVLPLIMGAITAIIPSEKVAWLVTLIVALICTVAAFGLVLTIFGGDTILYRMGGCLLYTSPSPRDLSTSRMPSSA